MQTYAAYVVCRKKKTTPLDLLIVVCSLPDSHCASSIACRQPRPLAVPQSSLAPYDLYEGPGVFSTPPSDLM